MKLNISISIENAAFDMNPEYELKHILERYLEKWQPGLSSVKLMDSNGNTVGYANVTDGIPTECPHCGNMDDIERNEYNDGRCERLSVTCCACGHIIYDGIA